MPPTGKLDLYALGQGGVNVVKSPIQLKDDECRSAQNAIFSKGAEGGLRKRGGLAKLNSTALNGGANILSIVNLDLPNPFNTSTLTRKYLYAGYDGGGGDTWYRSIDGTTWALVTQPQLPGVFSESGSPILGLPPVQPVPGKLLYVRSDGGSQDFGVWDGSSDEYVQTVPPADGSGVVFAALASGFHNGAFYFSTLDQGPRVYAFDLVTGQLALIVGVVGTSYIPFSIISYVGQLFVGASDDNGGGAPASFIYRCDPDNATAWVTDSAALDGVPVSMVNFLGNLYIGTGSRIAAVQMRVYKRTPSGTYSTVLSDANPWNVTAGGQLAVFANKIFAYQAGVIYSSSDGAAWASDLDVYTTYTSFVGRPGRPVEFGGALYWPFDDTAGTGTGRVLKRTSAGVWSSVLGPDFLNGVLTVFEVP